MARYSTAQRVGHREQIFLVALVVLVVPDAARRHRRQEGLDVRHAAERGFQVVEVLAQRGLALVAHGPTQNIGTIGATPPPSMARLK